MDYSTYLDRMIVEIADRQSGEKIESVRLEPIHTGQFPTSPRSWLESLATELDRQGFGIDWQATDNLSFLPNGALFARAAELRRANSSRNEPGTSIDWSKWGSMAGIAAIPLAILLWWFT